MGQTEGADALTRRLSWHAIDFVQFGEVEQLVSFVICLIIQQPP